MNNQQVQSQEVIELQLKQPSVLSHDPLLVFIGVIFILYILTWLLNKSRRINHSKKNSVLSFNSVSGALSTNIVGAGTLSSNNSIEFSLHPNLSHTLANLIHEKMNSLGLIDYHQAVSSLNSKPRYTPSYDICIAENQFLELRPVYHDSGRKIVAFSIYVKQAIFLLHQ